MNQPSEKIYVIRNLSFFYNDEYYSTLFDGSWHIGHMSAIFTDKASAMQEWKRLEHAFSHRVEFRNLFHTDYMLEYYADLGIHNFDHLLTLDYDEFNAYLKNLDPNQLFDIIHKADFHVYYLYEYPKNLKQHVKWNDAEQRYETCDVSTDYDHRPNIFLEAAFLRDDPLLTQMSPPLTENAEYAPVTLKGSLAELSETPALLASLIEQNPSLEYDEQNKRLTIKPDEEVITQVNTLLKQPLSEKSFLTIQQIYDIEQKLAATDDE